MLGRRRGFAVFALATGLALGLSACGGGGGESDGTGGSGDQAAAGFAACKASPNTCNAGTAKKGGTITFGIEKDMGLWNVNHSEGNVFEGGLVIGSILPAAFYPLPDLSLTMNKDLLESAEQTSTDPQTIVYKIKDTAVWNDGTPITADDFILLWKFMNGKDSPQDKFIQSDTNGYAQIKSVEGSDNGKTVTVVFAEKFSDWKSVFGGGNNYLYPSHIAKQQGDITTEDGLFKAWDYFGKTTPTYSGGPFKVENFDKGVSITLARNDKWYGSGPNLDKLIFRVISDQTQELPALQNNEVQMIYPQPNPDLVQQAKNNPNLFTNVGKGLVWEHFDLNLENEFLKDKPLRQALFTALDREDLIAKTIGQIDSSAEPLNNHDFVPGQKGYEDHITPTGYGSGDVDKAKQILTDAGYKGVGTKLMSPGGKPVSTLRIRYTAGNQVRQHEVELFQAAAKQLGVTMRIQPINPDALGTVLTEHDFDVVVFAWVASPATFSGALQNWTTTGGGNYGSYSNPQVDQLLKEASAMPEDVDGAIGKVNEAGKILSEDAYVLPLYQKLTTLVIQKNLVNVRDNPTNIGPAYNVNEWGLR